MNLTITGDENWLETPAGRSWMALHNAARDGYRWSPQEVADDVENAHRILSASGRVGPRGYGASWIGEHAGGGASHRATEWTWAEEVVARPQRYLMRRHPLELDAVALHVRRATGERLTDPERKAIATRTHRDRRHRAWVLIAGGLMRDKVRNTRPGEGIIDDAGLAAPDDGTPGERHAPAWRAPETPEEIAAMPTPEEIAEIAQAMVEDARAAGPDPAPIIRALAVRAAATWFADHPRDTVTMTRQTKLASRLKAAALAHIQTPRLCG